MVLSAGQLELVTTGAGQGSAKAAAGVQPPSALQPQPSAPSSSAPSRAGTPDLARVSGSSASSGASGAAEASGSIGERAAAAAAAGFNTGGGGGKRGAAIAGTSFRRAFTRLWTGARAKGEGAGAAAAAGGGGPSSTGLRPSPSTHSGSGAGSMCFDPDDSTLFTLSVALTHLVDVERQGGARLKVYFQPVRPLSSTTRQKETATTWVKGMLFPFWYPVQAAATNDYSVDSFLSRCDSLRVRGDGAAGLDWLSRGLPFNADLTATSVTCTLPRAGQPSPGQDEREDGQEEEQEGDREEEEKEEEEQQQQEVVVATLPQWQSALALPPGADACCVWLHTPLGPARVRLGARALRKAAASGLPCSTAVELPASSPGKMGGSQRSDLRVEVHWSARAEEVAEDASGAAAKAAAAGAGGGLGAGGARGGGLQRALAVMLAAAWLAACVASLRSSVLQRLAAAPIVLLPLAAAALGVAAAWAAAAGARGGEAAARPRARRRDPAPAPPLRRRRWVLQLLRAELVRIEEMPIPSLLGAGAAGLSMVRHLSVSGATELAAPPAPPPACGAAAPGAGVGLPAPLARLVAAHPGILTPDKATRFLVGLGAVDSAALALERMVRFVQEEGLKGLPSRPQPKFEARGVTEAEILHHLLFTYEYAFTILDPRPLPAGKTIKARGLGQPRRCKGGPPPPSPAAPPLPTPSRAPPASRPSPAAPPPFLAWFWRYGLAPMRDVTSAAFAFYLKRAGALLGTFYPQRLHKAFLVNAPTWSSIIWKLISAVIPQNTRERLQLFSKAEREAARRALLEWMPEDQLPLEFGGTADPAGLQQLEREMLEYVRSLGGGGARSAASGAVAAAGPSPA
eukprot:scaffold19.g1849.t1